MVELNPQIMDELKQVVDRGLLKNPQMPPSGSILLKDFRNALYAAHVEPKPIGVVDFGFDPKKILDWTSLRQSVAGSVGAEAHNTNRPNGILRREQFINAEAEIGSRVEEQLLKSKFSDIAEEVYADFSIILLSLHYPDRDQWNLGKILLSGYKSGGWPCGWEGKMPEGNLLMFWPFE